MTIYVDGNFKSGVSQCKYHISPSCHPAQMDENNWKYACDHIAWPENQEKDFPPIVYCKGDIKSCEIPLKYLTVGQWYEIYQQDLLTEEESSESR